jgi:hypothetical protein
VGNSYSWVCADLDARQQRYIFAALHHLDMTANVDMTAKPYISFAFVATGGQFSFHVLGYLGKCVGLL